MSYGDFKDLARRTASHKVLIEKAFNIAKNIRCNGYQRSLAFMVYKVFDENSKGGVANNEIKQNEQLAEELHKLIIKKFLKRVYSSFKVLINLPATTDFPALCVECNCISLSFNNFSKELL